MTRHIALVCIADVLAASPSARAAITVLDFYRMGEDDSGLVQQGAATSSTSDSAGTNPLSLPGAPTYTTDVAPGAAAHVGSSFSLYFFTAGVYGTGTLLSNVT